MLALVVIPTYDEADNIRPLTSSLLELDLDLNILIVDDNSPDGTGRIADELAAADPRISVMHREGKQGLASAYTAGFKHGLNNSDAQVLRRTCPIWGSSVLGRKKPMAMPMNAAALTTIHLGTLIKGIFSVSRNGK